MRICKGRGNAPFPCTPSPKSTPKSKPKPTTKSKVVYTENLTDPSIFDCSVYLPAFPGQEFESEQTSASSCRPNADGAPAPHEDTARNYSGDFDVSCCGGARCTVITVASLFKMMPTSVLTAAGGLG